jgi:hypothetical protein
MAHSVARRLLYVFTPKGWGGQAFLTTMWLFLAYFAIAVAFETGSLWAYLFTLIFLVLALRNAFRLVQSLGRRYLAVKATRKRG